MKSPTAAICLATILVMAVMPATEAAKPNRLMGDRLDPDQTPLRVLGSGSPSEKKGKEGVEKEGVEKEGKGDTGDTGDKEGKEGKGDKKADKNNAGGRKLSKDTPPRVLGVGDISKSGKDKGKKSNKGDKDSSDNDSSRRKLTKKAKLNDSATAASVKKSKTKGEKSSSGREQISN
jgi:hypothetical protein